jgi:hypothetical protein
MHVVAINRLQGSVDQLACRLAGALDVTPYEARARVMVPGGGPAVVGAFAAPADAAACVRRLQGAGFATLIVDSSEIARDDNRFDVYQIRFGGDALEAVARNGGHRSVPFASVTLLLRGMAFGRAVESSVVREKKFSPGRAVLSGGLLLRKTVETVTETTTSYQKLFLMIYAAGQSPLVLNPEQMDFSTLGSNLRLTREANFAWVCAELRRNCARAVWDERLQTRQGQAQLLGPTLSPDVYLDLGIALLARAAATTVPSTDPY